MLLSLKRRPSRYLSALVRAVRSERRRNRYVTLDAMLTAAAALAILKQRRKKKCQTYRSNG
jgi:hypothetical protein